MANTNFLLVQRHQQHPAPSSGHYHQGVPLEVQAAHLFPDSEFNQSAWIKAVRYLRRREPSIWKLDRPIGATPTQRY